MDRLRDGIEEPDPVRAEAARLLRSARPRELSSVDEARVRRALGGRKRGSIATWALRPAVIALVLGTMVAVAGATIARMALERRSAPDPAPSPQVPRPVPGPPRGVAPSVAAPPASPVPPAPAPGSSAPAPSRVALPEPGHSAPRAPAPIAPPPPPGAPPAATPIDGDPIEGPGASLRVPEPPSRPTPAPPPTSEPDGPAAFRDPAFAIRHARGAQAEEVAYMLDAVRALRVENDLGRARMLLDGYLRFFPRGVLKEEALALSIEAAASGKDRRAAALAGEYLARYPEGRFREAAEQARKAARE